MVHFFFSSTEIPLFHVLNARITFGNIQASEEEAQYVTTLKSEEEVTCCIAEECFDIPENYGRLGKRSTLKLRGGGGAGSPSFSLNCVSLFLFLCCIFFLAYTQLLELYEKVSNSSLNVSRLERFCN